MGKNREHLERIVSAGHELGNHSYSHSFLFPLFSAKKIAGELRRTDGLLKEVSGREPVWFRPPFGVSNPNINRGLKLYPMKIAGWSIRSFDTRGEHAGKVLARIRKRLRGGDVILLHDHSIHILGILEGVLQMMKEKGLEGVSLGTLCEDQ